MTTSWRRRVVRALWTAHRWLYVRTGGRVGGRLVGMPVLLLTTWRRRTGGRYTVALTYLPDGPNAVVIASNGGAPHDPQWCANLRARPDAWVQIGGRHVRIRARVAEGAERDRYWARAVAVYRGYAAYQQRARRKIPVIVLEPAEAEAGGPA